MKYLMGIDNGGTFSKAALFDEDGKQISVASVPTVTITPKPGYTERDMDELWEVNAQAVRNAIEKSNIDPKDIAGVSFSGHGKGLYMVGYDGKPSYNGIISTVQEPGHRSKDGMRMALTKRFMRKLCRTFWQYSR